MGDWNLTGKTNNILKRLPHLFHPPGAGDLLLNFVDLLGRRLEKGESDLYTVLRSHHVQTADNEGSRGFTAVDRKRGDLDKIFALYLEVVGGTSQLIKLKPEFTRSSMDFRHMAALLWEEDDSFIRFLREKAFQVTTIELLNCYHIDSCQVFPTQIKSSVFRALLTRKTKPGRYILDMLKNGYPGVYQLVGTYSGGGKVLPEAAQALADWINTVLLKDPFFGPQNFDWFRDRGINENMRQIVFELYDLDRLQKLSGGTEVPGSSGWDREIKGAIKFYQLTGNRRAHAMDDLIRLNRHLLSLTFPPGLELFEAPPVPSFQEVRAALLMEFNALLDREDLFNNRWFPDLEEDYPFLVKKHEEESRWLNRILIEAAFPVVIEKSYVPYRERLRGILKILKQGASTCQGIKDIVAANLGIYGDTPEASAAKAQIDIEEFAPEKTNFFKGELTFYQTFTINNTNPRCEAPEITLKIKSISPYDGQPQGEELRFSSLKIVRLGKDEADYAALFSDIVSSGSEVVFKKASDPQYEGDVFVNGFLKGHCRLPSIEEGESTWRFEATIYQEEKVTLSIEQQEVAVSGDFVAGRFDEPDSGLFDSPAPGYSYDNIVFATDEPVVEINMDSYILHPGIFSVSIPYHIPGFTDKFSETGDHPRNQLLSLVSRVKAAGVAARINYKQTFEEDQELGDRLAEIKLEGELLNREHLVTDGFAIESRQQGGEEQEMSDALGLSGRFDITGFDTLNRFD